MSDIRSMLRAGKIQEAIDKFGQDNVENEVYEMTYDDLADTALEVADAIGSRHQAVLAAAVVRNSGSYGEKARELAAKYPR